MSVYSYDEIKEALYRAIQLAYVTLDSEWTKTDDELRNNIISTLGIDRTLFDEAMKDSCWC